MLRDFGLTEGMILNLMTEWTGFEDDWLQGKLDSADTYSQNTAGCKSFAVEYPAAAASLAANKITMEQALGYWKKVADGVEKYGRSQEEAEVEALAYLEKERAKAKSEDDACVRDANIGAELTTAVGSDDHLACLFTEAHSNYFRYVHEHGKWREFDGHCWIEAAYPLVCDLVRGQARIMAQEIAATDEKISPSTLRGFTSGQKISAGEKLARGTPGILISHSAFDADPRCFNTPAGIVDGNGLLVTRGLAERYCTKSAAVAPGGDCTQWRRFLDEITDGDKELQAYLQRMAGYCLTGLTDEQVMFFLYGTGANGKGVFINTLSAIWADYARVAPADTFTQHFGDRHPTDMAMLQGARLVTAQETNEGQAWDEAKIKALTGGDPISARLMRQDFFTYQPQFKLVIAGNHKPRLRVVDEAIRRRLHMIPFAVTIPPESRDGQLQEKLKTEWSGILQWAIEGMLEWKRIGLTPPRAVLDLTEAYLATQDRLADWIEDCCVVGRQEWASGADLYRSFIGHPAAQDGDRLGPKQFGDLLESHDFKRAKRGHDGVRGYSGLALKDIET
jgi:putative DNA primase/helicase